VLNEKNSTIVPIDARTAIITAIAAASRRRSDSALRREPTSALNTYSDGNVTASVSRNSAGTLIALAMICRQSLLPLPVMANAPMHAP
jgi:hypothetical protein